MKSTSVFFYTARLTKRRTGGGFHPNSAIVCTVSLARIIGFANLPRQRKYPLRFATNVLYLKYMNYGSDLKGTLHCVRFARAI